MYNADLYGHWPVGHGDVEHMSGNDTYDERERHGQAHDCCVANNRV